MKFIGRGLRASTAAVFGTCLLLGACASQQTTRSQPAEPPPAPAAEPAKPAEQPKPTGQYYRPSGGSGLVVSSPLAIPTGEMHSSGLVVYQVTPAEVRAGAPYTYEIHVANLTSNSLENVVVRQESVSNLTVTGSQPSATKGANGDNIWALGNMAPKGVQVIKVNASAPNVGNAGNCVSASYDTSLCSTVRVVNPALTIEKTATPEVLLCDEITLTYRVCNTGTGVATNVRIRDTLPAGLKTASGATTIDQPVRNLAAGECEVVTVKARAEKVGRYEGAARASADGNLAAESRVAATVVRQPVLAITAECRDEQFLERSVVFEFTVKNTGDAPSNNTIVRSAVPSNAKFQSALAGGTLQGTEVVWNLGALAAGQSRNVAFTVMPNGAGVVQTRATVEGVCSNKPAADCRTNVVGIPAILLEVVDLSDPVEVGTQTTYVIQVTNQGTADDRNIVVTAELPAELEIVNTTGQTRGTVAGNKVTFAAMPVLTPKATAEWRIVVRAKEGGNINSRFFVVTENRQAQETESTTLYR